MLLWHREAGDGAAEQGGGGQGLLEEEAWLLFEDLRRRLIKLFNLPLIVFTIT